MNVDVLKNGVSYLRYYGIHFVESTLYYGGKLVGRFVFPIILIRNFKPREQSYSLEYELKSTFRIFFEHLWYIIKTGEINKNYYLFGFDRKGKNDFKNYVPWLAFTNARNRKNQLPLKPSYDPYNFICMLRDKFVFEGFCKGVGIKTSNNIAMINKGKLYHLKQREFIPLDNIVDFEVDAFLKRNVGYGGGMGYDVMPLRIENEKIFVADKLMNYGEFKELIGDGIWVIQERIKNQHRAVKRFHPNSINTVRIITVNTGYSIEVLASFLRVGINGRYADNTSSGGIYIRINVEDGTLHKWALSDPRRRVKYDKHPNTEIVFENFKLPYWREVVDCVKRAHCLFYGLHSIGWDVCITSDGPILIEGNDNWDTVDGQDLKKEYLKYFKNKV